MASPSEAQPQGSDPTRIDLNSEVGRLGYAVERFKVLTKDPDAFKIVLARFGYNPNQTPFVAGAANLVNTGTLTVTEKGHLYKPTEKPDEGNERIPEGTYTEVDSLGKGFARLTVHTPKDLRIIDGGYVRWNLVSRAEGADLRRLAEKNGDFLSLVLVDPSLLEARNFRQFIMAAHGDDPNLQPQTWYSGLAIQFAGKTAFKRVQGPGVVDATLWSKDRHWNETWVVGVRSQSMTKPDVLVGKEVSS
jgi:hypothetical protein